MTRIKPRPGAASCQPLWVLRADREPTPWPGRWLVVIDSQRSARPEWAHQVPRR